MDITYHGHSCFKIKTEVGTVVTDPFAEYVGLPLAAHSADIVTVSHHHKDHDAVNRIKGTARRDKPFIVEEAGEYEVGGISLFGVKTFHDNQGGVERGSNFIFTIMAEDIRVCHLGDLGHELTTEQLAEIGPVDVVICPIGGTFTIDPNLAIKVIHSLEPSIAIPMHYRTDQHDEKVFGDLKTLADFVRVYGMEPAPIDKLQLNKSKLPEETELVLLNIT